MADMGLVVLSVVHKVVEEVLVVVEEGVEGGEVGEGCAGGVQAGLSLGPVDVFRWVPVEVQRGEDGVYCGEGL
jgi:hypothetical protein